MNNRQQKVAEFLGLGVFGVVLLVVCVPLIWGASWLLGFTFNSELAVLSVLMTIMVSSFALATLAPETVTTTTTTTTTTTVEEEDEENDDDLGTH